MERYRRALARLVAELLVGTTLPYLHESHLEQDCDHFCRFEYRDVPHSSGDYDRLDTHELRVELGFPVFEQHFQDFSKIRIQFVEIGSLRVRSRKPWHVPDEETRLRVTLDHC